MEALLLFGICLMEGVRSGVAICMEPSPGEVPVKATRLSDVQPTYEPAWPLVYKCDQGTGHGYIHITCAGAGGWTGPARQCEEDIPFGLGSGIGVACFVFTFLMTVLAVSMATALQNKEKTIGSENEMSPRAQSPPAQNGEAGGHEKGRTHVEVEGRQGDGSGGQQPDVGVTIGDHKDNTTTAVDA